MPSWLSGTPRPSSDTRRKTRPRRRPRVMVTRVAPASMQFSTSSATAFCGLACERAMIWIAVHSSPIHRRRSEEHTSELQSRLHLVCRLLLEKKKKDKHVHQFICTH